MRLSIPKCPDCGKAAVGSYDLVPGRALFSGDPTEGDVEYSGRTDIEWACQLNAAHWGAAALLDPENDAEDLEGEDAALVVCAEGHVWFTLIDEDPTQGERS